MVEEYGFPRIILLLGSYDGRTKSLLYRLKDQLDSATMSLPEQVSVLLLDEIELYRLGSDEAVQLILVEAYNGGLSLSVLDGLHMRSSEDFPGRRMAESDEILSRFVEEHYPNTQCLKLPLLEKLKEFAQISALVFLIRHLAMTRGGEYIELGFLLSQRLDPSKVHFFKREGIDISEMAWEILDLYKVSARPYKNEQFLVREAIRVARIGSMNLS